MGSGNTKSNFGKWGWSMIIYCAISFYLAAAMSTDGLNWFPAAFSAYRGWGENVINLSNAMAGIGGWIGVVAAVIFSVMAEKWGSKVMAVLGNVLCGIFCLIFANTHSVTAFLIMIVLLTFVSGNIQLNVVPNNIMNIWFPRKKGLALGWASMGLPLCTATIILIFNAIGNPQVAYNVLAIIAFIVAFISIFWVKNTPEEVGVTPDNESIDMEQAMLHKQKQEEEAAHMTMGVIMKNKNTWLIGIGLGILWMTTIGLVSNFVPRLIMVGVSQQFAVSMLTIAAVVGIVGSYFWGWLDQKFSTKTASIIYGVWYLIALLLMIFHNGSMVMTGLVVIFVGCGIGGIGNLIPSMIGTCFGRFGFIKANRVIAPLNTVIRSTALVIIGAVGTMNITKAYWIFFVCSVIAIILVAMIKQPERD